MPSGKKKKGRGSKKVSRSRPAAGTAAASSASGTNPDDDGALRRHLELQQKHMRYCASFKSLPPSHIVDEIRRGADLPTQAVVQLTGTDSRDIEFRGQLVEAGMIDVVLDLLGRCEDEDFLDVLADIKGGGDDGGDLADPSVWVTVLMNTISNGNLPDPVKMTELRLKVANGIGPMVRSMVDDRKREFFKNNKEWHMCIYHFIGLMQNLVLTKATVEIIFQYDGLVDMLVQSMFWRVHREDIVEESKSHGTFVPRDVFSKIEFAAGWSVQELADVDNFREKATKRVCFLAKTPIISTVYAPKNTDTFVHGLIHLVKNNSSVKHTHIFWILNQFVFLDCVDKRLIKELVEFGASIPSYEDAEDTVSALNSIFMPRSPDGMEPMPNDSRYAIAIDFGLFEMCIRMLRGPIQARLINAMTSMLKGASAVSLLKKSSKAITNRREKIDPLLKLAAKTPVSPACQVIVKTIQSILKVDVVCRSPNIKGCRKCYEILEGNAAKQCAKCKRAYYCSRDCQVADWPMHKRDCKYMNSHANQVELAGHSTRDVKKAEAHEKNVSMAGNKAFTNNMSVIMMRAIFQQQNIIDCVVVIDLKEAPLSIEVKHASDFLRDCRESQAGDYDHTKRVVERNQTNGAITCACQSLGVYGEFNADGIAATAVLLKTFPGVAAPNGSWSAYQKDMADRMPADFEMYKHDKELREEFLLEMSEGVGPY